MISFIFMMTWIVGVKQCSVIGYPDINTICKSYRKIFYSAFATYYY